MRLTGLQIVETNISINHSEGESSAMKNDNALNEFVQINYPAWRDYYTAKWGGDRDQETFATPFGK